MELLSNLLFFSQLFHSQNYFTTPAHPSVCTGHTHTQGEKEEFFIAGGFSITNDKSVTDVSANEAVPLDELDESAIKAGHAEATREMGSKEAGSLEHATAQTEVSTYQAMARAVGITL